MLWKGIAVWLLLFSCLSIEAEIENGSEIEIVEKNTIVQSKGEQLTLQLNLKAQKAAVKAWARSLTNDDYNISNWVTPTRRQPQYFFDYYVTKLSDLFSLQGATVNFALVGACDGTNDNTIRDRYLPNSHWRGVFVEPISYNFKDLNRFMDEHGVANRTHLIHGAATSKCNSTTIKMKRPNHEEKNASLPHWMRRQIGAIVPFTKLDRPMTGGWVAEYVRCVTGSDILTDWAAATSRNQRPIGRVGKNSGLKKMRAHVLKIDVEGHDFDVLMSFIPDEVPNVELPLLINFEAKSIADKFPLAKQRLENRGYIVSNFATDGFALLRGDRIYNHAKIQPGASTTTTTVQSKPDSEVSDQTQEGGEEEGKGRKKRGRRKKGKNKKAKMKD